MSGIRFALFVTTALAVWGLVHAYVFWRLSSVPWIAAHLSARTLVISAVVLWPSYVLARMLEAWGLDVVALPVEWVSVAWMGVVLLMFFALLVVEVVTAGGFLMSKPAPVLRGLAVVAALVLAAIAQVQGLRAPVVSEHEVTLRDLPAERDGLRVVAVSDLHLGTLLGARWLTGIVQQVNALKPDLILALGDVVDGDGRHIEPLAPVLQSLSAPLGVWAVTGNHEFYVGVDRSVALLETAGWRVLRDKADEVLPGLVLAGVDDLTARQQFGDDSRPLEKTLAGRPPGATILLSHSPWQMEEAAAHGVGLMLAGHTHAGQIWPFNYLVRLRYPLVSGRHEVEGMTVMVCRGTGTWGPRMRLWQRSEILLITLRSAA